MKVFSHIVSKTQIFLTSALDEGEWSASRPGLFIPGKIARANHLHNRPEHDV
jgi:hypothetical protein